jgi:hypothetical protein
LLLLVTMVMAVLLLVVMLVSVINSPIMHVPMFMVPCMAVFMFMVRPLAVSVCVAVHQPPHRHQLHHGMLRSKHNATAVIQVAT